MKTCIICGDKHYAKGFCRKHYKMPSQLNPKPIKRKSLVEQMVDHLDSIHKSRLIIKSIIDNAKHKPQLEPLPQLLKRAEKVFNAWIRKRDSRSDGTFKCISCGLWRSTKEMDCGHFIGKRSSYLRFNEDNCSGECLSCNRFDGNHLIGYAVHLQEKIGYERYNQLLIDRVKTKKWDRQELLNIIEKYK